MEVDKYNGAADQCDQDRVPGRGHGKAVSQLEAFFDELSVDFLSLLDETVVARQGPEFEPDEGLASQLRMKGSELTDLARKAGLDVGDLDLIRELKGMPEEFQHLKQLIERRRVKPAFPERASLDPERRLRRARTRAHEAPGKKYEKRLRNVRTSSAIGEKVTYLRQSYTNEDSELICQMCEHEMPFRGRDNEYYFEAVQIFDDLAGEYVAGHVALCPLCAAKFKELVKRDEKRRQRLRYDIVNSEELRVGLDLGKEAGSIRFVEKHLLDIQGFLAEEDEQVDARTNS